MVVLVDDAALLEAWRGGDERAGNELFERHYPALARFFRNKLGTEADDLIQKTFLACVEARQRFEGRSSFRTFIFAVAHNVLRRELRDRSRGEAIDVDEVSLASVSPTPSTALARKREHRTLLAALRHVPASAQVLLELHYFEGMTAPEIADVFAIGVSTAKTRLRRGRLLLERVARELDEEGAAGRRTTTDDLDRWAAQIRDGVFPPDAER